MANYTQTQLDALREAYARGVREVEYDGQRVRYGSAAEMERAIKTMERNISGNAVKRVVYGTSRGLR